MVEAKSFQIAPENLVNMNSTSSHVIKNKSTLQKVVFIKKDLKKNT
jgi:hypothetical protein